MSNAGKAIRVYCHGKEGEDGKEVIQGKRCQGKRVRFQFQAPEAKMVSLAGNFNDWDTAALSMKKDKEGNWKTGLNLGPGRYEYRFFMDGTWQDDPNAQERVDNPFGGQNSLMVVG